MLPQDKFNEVIRFVFRKDVEERLGKPRGFIESEEDNGIEVHFAKRGELEEDESRLQVIPYVVLRTVRNGKPLGILMYTRNGSESRLLNKVSVGFGGHSNDSDENIRVTACREIEEEIKLSFEPYQLNFVGYIFSNNDAVSRVHIGYVYTSDISEETFEKLELSDEIKEVCVYDGSSTCEGTLENWSSILLNDEKLLKKLMR